MRVWELKCKRGKGLISNSTFEIIGKCAKQILSVIMSNISDNLQFTLIVFRKITANYPHKSKYSL